MQQDFNFNIALVFAHSILLESKGAEPLGEVWALNGGDPPATPVGESTADMLKAFTEGLPGFLRTMSDQIVPTEEAKLKGAQSVSKPYADLTADIYDTTGRRMNQIGEEIATSNQLAKARSDANVLAGPGQDIIKSADAAQRLIDPEFYNLKEGTGRLGNALIASYGNNPGELGGSERAEIERGLAQSNAAAGTFGSPSQVNTVQNAMAFGRASNDRRDRAASMLNTLAQPMQATRSGVDVLQQATGRPGQSNSGAPYFTGAREAGDTAFGQGQGLFGQIGDNQRTAMQINANRRDSMDRVMQGIGTVGSALGSVSKCCFIFLESYHGELPNSVRWYRDMMYQLEPRVARGYVRMAGWLVPAMRQSSLVRAAVWKLMVSPMTKFGKWFYCISGYSQSAERLCWVKNFWFSVWRFLG